MPLWQSFNTHTFLLEILLSFPRLRLIGKVSPSVFPARLLQGADW